MNYLANRPQYISVKRGSLQPKVNEQKYRGVFLDFVVWEEPPAAQHEPTKTKELVVDFCRNNLTGVNIQGPGIEKVDSFK